MCTFQCVGREYVCDLFPHCLDNSDESICTTDDVSIFETRIPPGIVELDGRGSFIITELTGLIFTHDNNLICKFSF